MDRTGRKFRNVPLLLGIFLAAIASVMSGMTGAIWFAVGCFFGGWVPLYFMPWLRRRS